MESRIFAKQPDNISPKEIDAKGTTLPMRRQSNIEY